MPKLTINDIVLYPREVDVPEKCPKCNADFLNGDGSLAEWNYFDYKQFGKLENGEDSLFFESNTTMPKTGEASIVIGYACGECGFILADANEETAKEK